MEGAFASVNQLEILLGGSWQYFVGDLEVLIGANIAGKSLGTQQVTAAQATIHRLTLKINSAIVA